MRPLRSLFAALALFSLATPAFARHPEVAASIPSAQQVGAGRYSLLSIPLFQAELWTSSGAFSWERPFALSLIYERSIRANSLVNRTISEMRQRGAGSEASLQPLRAPLTACFADVQNGDRITGVSTGANTARFYLNGAQRCEIEWPNFRRHFFGIWLDARGGQAALSAQLRGES
ncbi:chalcone isomerase family protein [Vitreimonas sp.]|uniref:chalcone isomerase family protein n=1 Tax=Vitreimonas sp. TaxID=3069702 RepID=UPI002ED77F1A